MRAECARHPPLPSTVRTAAELIFLIAVPKPTCVGGEYLAARAEKHAAASRRSAGPRCARRSSSEHEQSVLNAQHACSDELPQRSLALHAVVVEQTQRL